MVESVTVPAPLPLSYPQFDTVPAAAEPEEDEAEVDEEIRKEIEEAMQEIDWEELKHEIEAAKREVMEEIDWEEIKKEMEEAPWMQRR